MGAPDLVLRDIHQPPAPPWWPPAPGWWLLLALVLLLAALWAWHSARQRRRRRTIEAVFDDAVAAAGTPTEQIAAMSELLRRAARKVDPGADRLDGEAWLKLLALDDATGWVLLEGGYQRDIDPRRVDELRPLARARFLQWTSGQRKSKR